MSEATHAPRATAHDGRSPGAPEPSRYTRVAMALHWVLALALFAQIAFGLYVDSVPQKTPIRSLVVNWHKTTGVLIGLLVLARIAWRLTHRPPRDVPMPRWQALASHAMHGALYVMMVVVPLSGYVASNFSKWGVKMFNRFELPPWGIESKAVYGVFNTVHQVGSWVLIVLVLGHVAAALWHGWQHDGTLERMLPGTRRGAR